MEILFVEPPSDVVHSLRRRVAVERGRGLRESDAAPGQLHLFQATKYAPRLIGEAADKMLAYGLRSALSRLDWSSALVWVNDPGAWPYVKMAFPRNAKTWPLLYDITDDWVAARRAPRETARLILADTELVEVADEVVVCSPHLLRSKSLLRPAGSTDLRMIPNAVDVDLYQTPYDRPIEYGNDPVVLYVGTLHEDRLDIELIVSSAREIARAGGRIFLVGPDALSQKSRYLLQREANIFLCGPKRKELIPAYMQHADVLVTPHIVDSFTESLDPIKYYEYLASGRPIVSTGVAGFRDDQRVRVESRSGFPSVLYRTLLSRWPTYYPSDIPTWADRVAQFKAIMDRF